MGVNLGTIWFVIETIFWVGFFVLEGFDFGVGMLHSFVGRTDLERRICVNTIGPVWDGNEVWLIVAGAVMFAAFPSWYATMFSTFYLALVLVLLALMLRGVSFEYTRRRPDPRWRRFWRWSLTIGSALAPLLIGVALGDMLFGLPIDSQHNFTGTFWQLLQPYGLWTGLTLLVLCLLMGGTYLGLKTTGDLHDRVKRVTTWTGLVAIIVLFGWLTWTHVGLSRVGFVPQPIQAVALLAVVGSAWAVRDGYEGWAFGAAAVAIGSTVGSIFTQLYPATMISSTNSAYNITVANAASSSYALRVMTVVAAVFFPLVLLYQGWSYHVFKGRLRSPRVGVEGPESPPDDGGPSPEGAAAVPLGAAAGEPEAAAEPGG